MTSFLTWLLPMLAAIVTTWLATIELTLRNGGRGEVERALTARDRAAHWTAIENRLPAVIGLIAFLHFLLLLLDR